MRDTRVLRLGIRALGGALLLAALLVPAAAGLSAAAPLSQPASGYWQYVETIYNDRDQAVDPIYTAEHWSPQFGESSLSGVHSVGERTTSGSCTWSYESADGVETLVEGEVVTVHLSGSYEGVNPDTSLNQLSAYACFNEAGVMGAGVTYGAVCTEMLVIPGPGGSNSRDLDIPIPAGPLFPSGRAALEVKCCPDCYKSMSAQRVYRWVEGAAPAGAAACEKVVLHYSPEPPVSGGTLFLTAGVDSTIGNSPGFSSRWVVDGSELVGGSIDEWDGCAVAADYHYTCKGQDYVKTLLVPGGNCGAGVGWRVAVGAGIVGAAAAAAAVLRRRRLRNPRAQEYILHLSTNKVEIGAGSSAPVTATVYQVAPEGPAVLAPQAPLRVRVAPGLEGLDAQPRSGTGSLKFAVSASRGSPGGSGHILVEGHAGHTRYTATVEVDVQAPFRLEMRTDSQKNVVPVRPGVLWAYARVVALKEGAQAGREEDTRRIAFSLRGDNLAAVRLSNRQLRDGWRAVRLMQRQVDLKGPGDPTLVASVQVKRTPLKGTLPLSLEPRYAIEFRDRESAGMAGRGQPAPVELLLPWRAPEPSHDENLSQRAVAYVVALNLSRTPPPPDRDKSQEIAFQVLGSHKECIEVAPASLGSPAKEATLFWRGLADGVAMKDDDPVLVAELAVGPKKVECRLPINLDDCRLGVLKTDLARIAADLERKGYYVRNAFLGAPGVDHLNQLYGITCDWPTLAWLSKKKKGITCGDYVRLTQDDVLAAVRRVYGGRASLSTYRIQEQSSEQWNSLADVADSLAYTVNHLLYKLTAPNGKEYSIDFWDHFRLDGSVPVLQDWSVTAQRWIRFMGDDLDKGMPWKPHLGIQEGRDPARARRLARGEGGR